MSSDGAGFIPFVKPLELDRSTNSSQRASDIAQEQLAGESAAAFNQEKAAAVEQLRREKTRQERERKRRLLERQSSDDRPSDKTGLDGDIFDVVA